MKPLELTVDPGQNIFRMSFCGVIAADAMHAEATHSVELIGQLRAGFTVLADLTDLERMELDCVPHITRLMDRFVTAGVGRVVRIIPDPDKDIGFTLLSLTHYRGRVPIMTCATRGEAELALAQLD